MENYKLTPKALNKGMYKDTSELQNPEGTYTFALNLIKSSFDVSDELTSEHGNSVAFSITNNYQPIGTVPMLDDRVVIFSTDGTHSEIGLQTKDTYEVLLNDTALTNKLNFSTQYPIKGEYRVLNLCDEYVYFVDGHNPDMYFCINRLADFDDAHKLYQKPIFNQIFLKAKALLTIGGNLPTGSISVCGRFLDDTLNPFDLSEPSPTIVIYDDNSLTNYNSLDGGPSGKPTNKAIIYQVILNNSMTDLPKYFEIAINIYDQETGVPRSYIYNRYATDQMNIYTESSARSAFDITVSHLDYNILKPITTQELIVPTAKLETSKGLILNDNRLIKYNLTERDYKLSAFQQTANEIEVTYQTIVIQKDLQNDTTTLTNNYLGGSKSLYGQQNKSFLRDEVYALGVRFLFNDGSLSPVFHIPGRQKDKDASGASLPTTDQNVIDGLTNRPNNSDAVMFGTDGFDSARFNDPTTNPDCDFFPDATERWQIYNTAYQTSTSAQSNAGELAYFECQEIDGTPINYPDDLDCDGNRIYPEGPIRHHKMPDATLERIFSETSGIQYVHYLGLYVDNLDLSNYIPADQASTVIGLQIVVGDREYNKTIVDKGIVDVVTRRAYRDGNENDGNRKKYLYTQANVFSHDNNSPVSLTMTSSDETISNNSFVALPACSETISYNTNNTNKIGDKQVDVCTYLLGFHSPKSKFNQSAYAGSHMKFENELITTLTEDSGTYKLSNDNFYISHNRYEFDSKEVNNIMCTTVNQKLFTTYTPTADLTNRNLLSCGYIRHDDTFTERISNNYPDTLLNKTQQEVCFYELQKTENTEYTTYVLNDLSAFTNLTYSALFGPASEMYTILLTDYTAGTNYLANEALGTYSAGGIRTTNYVSIKQFLPNIYSNLNDIIYRQNSPEVYAADVSLFNRQSYVFVGDIFITEFAFRKTFYGFIPAANDMGTVGYLKKNDDPDGDSADMSAQNTVGAGARCNAFLEAQLTTTFYESEINSEFREAGTVTLNNNQFVNDTDTSPDYTTTYIPGNADTRVQLYYPKYYDKTGEGFLMLEPNANSFSRLLDDGRLKYYQTFPNYYRLNPDLSKQQHLKAYFPLSYKYDLCDDCQNKYETRIALSDKSYTENVEDRFRVFRANEYTDIQANSGEIKDIFESQAKLYVNTTSGMYMLPANSQQIQTNVATTFIGTGEYLSIPPYRLSNTTYNYAGNQGRFNRYTSEYGVFFVNQEQGTVYKFTEQLKDISAGMQKLFYQNLPSEMAEAYFSVTQTEYPLLDNHTHKYGLGLISSLDYQNNRLILHKKDFIPYIELELFDPDNPPADQTFVFDSTNLILGVWDENLAEIVPKPFSNENYFVNKSLTLSFDVEEEAWLSFHSWQPDLMYNTGTMLYTNISDKNILKHDNTGFNYRTYYNLAFPIVLEYINYSYPMNFKLDSIYYQVRQEEYNSTYKHWKEITSPLLMYALCYNSYQTSGVFSIVDKTTPYSNYTWSNTQKIVEKVDKVHKVSGIKDLRDTAVNQPLFDSRLATIAAEYTQGQGYVDLYPNSAGVDYTKNFYEMLALKDNHCYTRYIIQQNPNYRVRIQILNSIQKLSYR